MAGSESIHWMENEKKKERQGNKKQRKKEKRGADSVSETNPVKSKANAEYSTQHLLQRGGNVDMGRTASSKAEWRRKCITSRATNNIDLDYAAIL